MNEQNPTFPTGVPGLFASRPIQRSRRGGSFTNGKPNKPILVVDLYKEPVLLKF